ncbi:MAG: pirin family protein [Alphaproteobacteria bacterium]|nr:pirin family protein [Alphaproteobacteria bacterium]
MIQIQPFDRLGRFQNAWLNARYHFSFGQYRDPARQGVGGLVVWNDDEIAPGTGFDPHPHREMEIITYVREGAITHRDSLGNEGRTEAGDIQVMHAGTGITHAEYNLEATPTRLFQIWIHPGTRGVAPGWGARKFPRTSSNVLTAMADGRAGADGSALPLYADAAVLAGTIKAGESVTHALGKGRVGYLVAATGTVSVNGVAAGTRDGVTVTGEESITIAASADAEVVLVDVVV